MESSAEFLKPQTILLNKRKQFSKHCLSAIASHENGPENSAFESANFTTDEGKYEKKNNNINYSNLWSPMGNFNSQSLCFVGKRDQCKENCPPKGTLCDLLAKLTA